MSVYPGADWHEREAGRCSASSFDGHPALRHLYLPSEFEGHPLRKDYPLLAREVKPWPGLVDVEPMPGEDDDGDEEAASRRTVEAHDHRHRPSAARRAPRGSTSTRRCCRQLADAQVNVELDTGDMVLNLGPQHPATHGTLRLVVRLDGERVIAADPVIGYMHRGYEKLTEFRTYPQITTLINRIDWLSSFANEVPFIDGAEMLMGDRGAAACAVHPHRRSPSCRASRPSCCSSARWACRSARSRPRSTGSATASTSSTSSRPSPAGASTRTSTASAA